MLTESLNIEELEFCQPLLQRAKSRKHPHLTHDEFIELQRLYRKAHWCPEDKPNGFTGHMGYSITVNRLADPALAGYLHQHGIVVLPAPRPKPLHPYGVAGANGMATIADIERKAKLAKKLKDLKRRQADV